MKILISSMEERILSAVSKSPCHREMDRSWTKCSMWWRSSDERSSWMLEYFEAVTSSFWWARKVISRAVEGCSCDVNSVGVRAAIKDEPRRVRHCWCWCRRLEQIHWHWSVTNAVGEIMLKMEIVLSRLDGEWQVMVERRCDLDSYGDGEGDGG